MFFAHSENINGERHNLVDHLNQTAHLVRSFAPGEIFKQLFYYAGLLHDIGKFHDGFQRYLFNGGPKVPHATLGALIARMQLKRFIPLPFVIKGHHAGLPNAEDLSCALDDCEDEGQFDIVLSRFNEYCNGIQLQTKQLEIELPNEKLLIECITRFLFSALTDADWLDTEKHFKPEILAARINSALEYENLIFALEKRFSKMSKNGKINKLRTDARNNAAQYFNAPIGFFSLQLPTGLGKTLTSIYWATLHAQYHRLKRIIVVLPYINIIDQNASILKELFGENNVIEHHSGIIDEGKDEEYQRDEVVNKDLTRRLACENWDAPIIVTTSVQFFDSLFSNRPYKCRKNHNISESIVIFDEVQTLPKHYSEPIIVMLKNITKVARTSFLFCTATQPAFAKRENFDGVEDIVPLINNSEQYFKATRRVNYIFKNELNEISLDNLVDDLSKETESFLVIVNTKTVAREVYQKLSSLKTLEGYYHLSTAMCPHHRKLIIENIISDLKPSSGKRIAVISTQLVEAGVDLDFPCVYRAIAPLDSVIQAAGRCNREGKRKKGRVLLFNLENHKMPDQAYKSAAAVALRMIKDYPTLLHKANSFSQFYEELLNLYVDADRYHINENRKKGNFQTVAESFRLIYSPTAPLFIKDYSNESSSLLREVAGGIYVNREQHRCLQQYSIQVYYKFLEKYSHLIEDLKGIIYIWHGTYDENIGISTDDVNIVF